ncbi:hypothetical protein ACWCW7_10555 [Nocardia tengchongensis]
MSEPTDLDQYRVIGTIVCSAGGGCLDLLIFWGAAAVGSVTASMGTSRSCWKLTGDRFGAPLLLRAL